MARVSSSTVGLLQSSRRIWCLMPRKTGQTDLCKADPASVGPDTTGTAEEAILLYRWITASHN